MFEDLAVNGSRNFKIDYLKQHTDNKTLKEVIRLALDPFTQFYIRKIPQYKQIDTTDIGLKEAIDQLGYLSKRIYTGNAGIEHLRSILCNLPEDKAQVIERIINKDLKCGVSVATANTVWPDLIKEYPCMLASGFEQKLVDKLKFPAMVQLKMDGMRFNAIVNGGKCEFRSRSGKELNLLGYLEDEFITIAKGENIVFDGELIVTDGFGVLDRQTGNGILSKAGKGTISEEEAAKVKAVIWDEIPLMFFKSGLYSTPYKDRFAAMKDRLRSLKSSGFKIEAVESQYVDNLEDAQTLFQNYFDKGEEGIILKACDMVWENKRSKKQIKFKGELECDLKIVALEEGSGKYKGLLGSLACESSDGTLKVSVGSGLTDEHRSSLNKQEYVGRVCSIKYNARIKNKDGEESLFLPIFIEVRDDKSEADSIGDIK